MALRDVFTAIVQTGGKKVPLPKLPIQIKHAVDGRPVGTVTEIHYAGSAAVGWALEIRFDVTDPAMNTEGFAGRMGAVVDDNGDLDSIYYRPFKKGEKP